MRLFAADPIEEVPLGARVPTKNPRPWEYDDSLPEPDQVSWAKLSITMYRTDGGIVDAELIRPRSWINSVGIEAGKLLPMNIEELQVKGSAIVTAIDDCPPIAEGEGSVVTARYCTREVHTIARASVARLSESCLAQLQAEGRDPSDLTPSDLHDLAQLGLVDLQTLSGTPIHPIWSEDRQDWVPLGELIEGETLRSASGLATVVSFTLETCSLPVYNIEVHGEHVYEVGELGLLVHNACIVDDVLNESASAIRNITSKFKLTEAEALQAGLKWLGSGFKEIGKAGSGVYRSADGLRQFRIDPSSLLGQHPPNIPHVHFEWFKSIFSKVPGGNNHVPIF